MTRPTSAASDAGFAEAVAAANAADQVVLALGETRGQGGEAEVRSVLDLPGKQQQLLDAIKDTGKPVTVVLFNSRPLTLGKVVDSSKAILEAWFPGIEAGNAVADVLFGKVNPGGKLPVSFPQSVGQIPIYYNHEPTGRPCDTTQKYNSRYRDLDDLRAAVCVRLRPLLHDVQDRQLAVVGQVDVLARAACRSRSTCRTPAHARATRSSSSTSTTRSRASRSRSAACAASSA